MTAPAASGSDALRDRLAAALAPAYTVEAELGRGGMSVVYRARDVRLRRDVAVKVLPPELAFVANVRERFMREAQTAAQLTHPHIVPIYGVEERDTLVWIVMALVEGETLGDRLAREGRVDGPETERILGSVADALAYAHAHGVIHRDIKPDNILIERDSKRVLVTDFGIARAAEGDGRLTLTGVAVGTPTYMSPEQAIGEGEVDGRTDLYSLGIVGYQMLAGAPPFVANSTPALMLKQVSEPLPPLAARAPSAPLALVAAIERALAKKPADRWPTLADFASALRNPRTGAAAAVDPVRLPPTPPVIGVPAMSRPARGADDPAPRSAPPPREARPLAPPPLRPPGLPVPPRPPVPLAGANAVPAWVYGASADAKSIALQAQTFRRHAKSTFATLAFLGIINGIWDGFPWIVFPAFGMLMGLSARWRPLGDAGLSFFDVMRNDRALESAGVEGTVPATLFSNSLAGRARRFARRIKVAAVAAGTAVVSLVVGSTFEIQALIPVMLGGGAVALVSAVSAMRAARPLRRLGFRRRDLLNGTWRDSEAARSAGTAFRLREEEVSQLAPPDVVMSAYGERLRLAVDDRTAIRQQMARLDGGGSSVIPDMLPTVNALVQRIAEVCGALHQLDRDMGSATDGSLDGRIAELRMRGVPDSDATLSLLLRQRQSIADLEGRRTSLRAKLESASLRLQGLRLDVLRLGSLGLDVPQVRSDVGMATEQAQALSRDLAYLLEGAREADRVS
ncbi:MAG: serine/threonine protein kinase [Gemmatimonadaceae bacterium]|nr:serine/threonine protein kinase [Gemmatimonadaceae bacterium]